MSGPSSGRDHEVDPAGEPAAFPGPLVRFVELFNREAFWESHEALEDAWRELDSGFYQGLILYASAFVHARRGTRHGIGAQLEKAEEALAPYAPGYLGVDVAAVLDHARRCREIVAASEEPPEGSWEEAIPFRRLDPRLERVRGDEPELPTVSGGEEAGGGGPGDGAGGDRG